MFRLGTVATSLIERWKTGSVKATVTSTSSASKIMFQSRPDESRMKIATTNLIRETRKDATKAKLLSV